MKNKTTIVFVGIGGGYVDEIDVDVLKEVVGDGILVTSASKMKSLNSLLSGDESTAEFCALKLKAINDAQEDVDADQERIYFLPNKTQVIDYLMVSDQFILVRCKLLRAPLQHDLSQYGKVTKVIGNSITHKIVEFDFVDSGT